MSEVKIYRLFITPKTKINISDNEKWMLSKKITDEYLLSFGARKRAKQIAEGKANPIKAGYYYKRKKYLMTYFDYKRQVKELFDKCGLKEYPAENIWWKFFIPMPKSWSQKKRNKHNFEKHLSKPDRGNLEKSVEDSLSVKDQVNWDSRASKFWSETGYIEIHIGALPEAKGYSPYVREEKIK
jgi:Holliday junction resolvase RusA-like endonuclease